MPFQGLISLILAREDFDASFLDGSRGLAGSVLRPLWNMLWNMLKDSAAVLSLDIPAHNSTYISLIFLVFLLNFHLPSRRITLKSALLMLSLDYLAPSPLNSTNLFVLCLNEGDLDHCSSKAACSCSSHRWRGKEQAGRFALALRIFEACRDIFDILWIWFLQIKRSYC